MLLAFFLFFLRVSARVSMLFARQSSKKQDQERTNSSLECQITEPFHTRQILTVYEDLSISVEAAQIQDS